MKNLKQKHWILLVLALQVAALGSIAAKREWIMNRGETVYLRTAPVDPRDLFRGDYVQLEYEISQPDRSLVPADLPGKTYQPVYLLLQRDHRGVAGLAGISLEKSAGLFIRGRIDRNWRSRGNNSLVKLGIEKYFVEQGSGLALEEQRGRGEGWQTPMEMQVALGTDGTAVIKDYRWSDLGVRLEVLEAGRNPNVTPPAQGDNNATAAPVERLSPKLRISLRNQSSHAMRIVDSAEHCAFSLVENRYDPELYGQSYDPVATPRRKCDTSTQWQEHVLQPQEIYSVAIDMAEEQWRIVLNDQELAIGEQTNNWNGFRWIYRLPADTGFRYATQPDVWLSPIRTARFTAGGRID